VPESSAAVEPADTSDPSGAGQLGRRRSEKTLVWHLIAGFCIPWLDFLARYPVIDGHKLPQTGAFILAPNYYSEIDPVIVTGGGDQMLRSRRRSS
jgi:1-acyl-sn-glycerol-3-phosphate acyltransferase